MTAQQVVDRVRGMRAVDLLRVEQDGSEPPCGWEALDVALWSFLLERVREALATGVGWEAIRLPGWTAADVQAAAAAVEGS